MASTSFHTWLGPRARKLDEIEAAHRVVSGSGRGRRRATEQLNHAYVLLLSSQFQGFCRDLHSECIDELHAVVANPTLAEIMRLDFMFARRLDRGNPTPGNIRSDFERLGVDLWLEVRHLDARNTSRALRLEQLSRWRNAIAHQDLERAALVPALIRFRTVRRWRETCDALARSFDRVMTGYLASVTGARPW